MIVSNSAASYSYKEGDIIFSDYSEGIFSYDFSNESLKDIYRTNKTFINRISRFGVGGIVFSECRFDGECEIKKIDKGSVEVTALGSGSCPVVIENSLYFCDRSTISGKAVTVLKHVEINSGKTKFNGAVTVVKGVNPDRLVVGSEFLYVVDDMWELSFYNYIDDMLINSYKKYAPLFYWKEKSALVAYSLNDKKYYLVRLENKSIVENEVELSFKGAPIMIFDGKGVVYSKAVREGIFGEAHHVFYQGLYGKESVLIKYKNINSGFVY